MVSQEQTYAGAAEQVSITFLEIPHVHTVRRTPPKVFGPAKQYWLLASSWQVVIQYSRNINSF